MSNTKNIYAIHGMGTVEARPLRGVLVFFPVYRKNEIHNTHFLNKL